MFAKILDRFREPSSWAAISIMLGLMGVHPGLLQLVNVVIQAAPPVIDALQQAAIGGAFGAAGLAFAVKEKGGA